MHSEIKVIDGPGAGDGIYPRPHVKHFSCKLSDNFFLQTSDTLEQGHDDQRLEISHFPLQASLSLAEGDQLGLMIRGGAEFGLGIFVTGVLY